MYVHEFGSECAVPNQRRICISYLDSVKYFRPEIEAATGEALRILVYHEILIGYLDYCKKRGFTSCYLWSCPSENQDDYILYRHPKTQKMPKPEILGQWYEKFVRKAKEETIVAEHTNLFDHFFMPDCKAKVTASCLPYFDGDFWPEEAEKFLKEFECPKKKTRWQHSSGKSKDKRIMKHIEKVMKPEKDKFIMLHFLHTCKHCGQHIVSGSRWICFAENFHLCDKGRKEGKERKGKERKERRKEGRSVASL